jgi:ribosomal protein L37AE/L43A
MTDDLGACPKCGAKNRWEYAEVEIWTGRRCDSCDGIFLHSELGLPEGETR